MDNLLHSRYALIAYQLMNTLSDHGHVSRAECTVDDSGNLKTITERLKIQKTIQGPVYEDNGKLIPMDDNTIVSMNMWGFMPSIFEFLDDRLELFLQENSGSLKSEFLLPDVIDYLIHSENMEVQVLESGEKWFGITYQEDLMPVKQKLANLVNEGVYPTPVWK